MAPNRISAIGLELEGGWSSGTPGFELVKRDGSVTGISGDKYRVGEVCSKPIKEWEDAEKWLRSNYPNSVNETCGFHVHVSLPPLHYSRLMNPGFEGCFLNAMEDFWSRFRAEPGFNLFRSRLDGQNQYCQKVFRPEDQIWRKEHYGERTGLSALPRYSQLNFCYGRHGTMECRLFPCFPQINHSVEAAKVFTECINSYLSTCPAETATKITVEVDMPEPRGPVALATAA